MEYDKRNTVRVLIAASGTGGHLFPALTIARAIKALAPAAEIQFVGSGRPLEEKVIDGAGFKRAVIKTVGIKRRGIFGFAQFLITLPGAFIKCWSIVGNFKPQVIVGVGGYVSFLPVLIGWLRSIPAWIHEAERKAGLANYVLSFFARKISLAFPDSKMPFPAKCIYTGQPVREEFREVAKHPHQVAQPKNLLVLGGSQGARALDLALCELAPFFKERGLNVWHQARAENIAEVDAAYKNAGLEAKVEPFITEMPKAYAWSDIVISRSGASAVNELGVVNRPAILVPYPFAQGGHQLFNAKTLVDAGKAELLEEGEEFSGRLKFALQKILSAENYNRMRVRPYDNKALIAASEIAKGCLNLATKSLM